jgi:hypothetical protein
MNADNESGLVTLMRQARLVFAANVEGAYPPGAAPWRSVGGVLPAPAGGDACADETLPAAGDELALSFLCRHNYDIPRARLVLSALLGAGEYIVLGIFCAQRC